MLICKTRSNNLYVGLSKVFNWDIRIDVLRQTIHNSAIRRLHEYVIRKNTPSGYARGFSGDSIVYVDKLSRKLQQAGSLFSKTITELAHKKFFSVTWPSIIFISQELLFQSQLIIQLSNE